MIKGIDISEWQEGLSLSAAKSLGYNFAILRAGYTGYGSARSKNKDACFEGFYKQAKEAGMPVGAYWYSCADSAEQGKMEADYMYENCLKGKQFEYPIYIDVEDQHWQNTNPKGVTDGIIAFCEALENKGYYVGVYASLYWFENKIETSRLADYTKWVAAWMAEKPSVNFNAFDMWQYASSTKIARVQVDTDECYIDFPAIIKEVGLNGYKPAKPEPAPVPTIELAKVNAVVDQASVMIEEANKSIEEATATLHELKKLLESLK